MTARGTKKGGGGPPSSQPPSYTQKIWYGKEFRHYGRDWVKVGLRDYVPLESLHSILHENGIQTKQSTRKPQLVDAVLVVYDKSDQDGKKRIEQWIYAYRYSRHMAKNDPFLQQINKFFNFLNTNPYHKIKVSPANASMFIKNISTQNIEDIEVIRGELMSATCKNKADYKAFNKLFNIWFLESYKMSPAQMNKEMRQQKVNNLFDATKADNSEELKRMMKSQITGIMNFNQTTDGDRQNRNNTKGSSENNDSKDNESSNNDTIENDDYQNNHQNNEPQEDGDSSQGDEGDDESEENGDSSSNGNQSSDDETQNGDESEGSSSDGEDGDESRGEDSSNEDDSQGDDDSQNSSDGQQGQQQSSQGDGNDDKEPPTPKCPKCGSPMSIDTRETQTHIEHWMVCTNCGYEELLMKTPKGEKKSIEDVIIEALIDDANILNYGIFLGYTIDETMKRLKKITYIIDPDSQAKGANGWASYDESKTWKKDGSGWTLAMSQETFDEIKKYYNADYKPESYWKSMYTFQHEFTHISRDTPISKLDVGFEEARTPLLQYIFNNHYNGMMNPQVMDVSIDRFNMMSMRKAPLNEVRGYPPHTYQFFDQMVAWLSINETSFHRFIKRVTVEHMTKEEVKREVKKTYPRWREADV